MEISGKKKNKHVGKEFIDQKQRILLHLLPHVWERADEDKHYAASFETSIKGVATFCLLTEDYVSKCKKGYEDDGILFVETTMVTGLKKKSMTLWLTEKGREDAEELSEKVKYIKNSFASSQLTLKLFNGKEVTVNFKDVRERLRDDLEKKLKAEYPIYDDISSRCIYSYMTPQWKLWVARKVLELKDPFFLGVLEKTLDEENQYIDEDSVFEVFQMALGLPLFKERGIGDLTIIDEEQLKEKIAEAVEQALTNIAEGKEYVKKKLKGMTVPIVINIITQMGVGSRFGRGMPKDLGFATDELDNYVEDCLIPTMVNMFNRKITDYSGSGVFQPRPYYDELEKKVRKHYPDLEKIVEKYLSNIYSV